MSGIITERNDSWKSLWQFCLATCRNRNL